MRRITPTGWAKQKGTPVTQLGSREAVLAKLADGSLAIVADSAETMECLNALATMGRAGTGITFFTAGTGPTELYRFAPETIVGVMPGAFDRIGSEVWPDFHRVLTTRFREVHWG